MLKLGSAGTRPVINASARILQRLRMTGQDKKSAELGPIARTLMKLAKQLRQLAATPLSAPGDVANDNGVTDEASALSVTTLHAR